MNKNKQKGFSLVELMLVISIISFLASVVLSSVILARKKSRDAKRVSDIRALQEALSLYYYDHGTFPVSGQAVTPDNSWSNSSASASWNSLQTALSPYINRLPHDPKETTSGWPGDGSGFSISYYSQSYGCSIDWYMIVYQLEVAKGPDPGASSCDTSWQYGGDGADTYIKTVGFVK